MQFCGPTSTRACNPCSYSTLVCFSLSFASYAFLRSFYSFKLTNVRIFSNYPRPMVARDFPLHRDASDAHTHETSGSERSGSRRTRSTSSDRARTPKRAHTQTRSMSYDRAVPSRSGVDASLGYGSLSGSQDLSMRSIPDGSGGQRYRSALLDLGPTAGETREERRKRMKELLRTLDKAGPRVSSH